MEIREQIWVYPFGMPHNPKGDEPFCVELNQSSHTGPGDMHLTRNRQFEKDQRQGRIEKKGTETDRWYGGLNSLVS